MHLEVSLQFQVFPFFCFFFRVVGRTPKNNAGVTHAQCAPPHQPLSNTSAVLAWGWPGPSQLASWRAWAADRVPPSATRFGLSPVPAAPAIGRNAPSVSISWPRTAWIPSNKSDLLVGTPAFQPSPDHCSILFLKSQVGPSSTKLVSLATTHSFFHPNDARFVRFLDRQPLDLRFGLD